MWDLILNPFVTVLALLYSIFGNNAVLAIIFFTILIRLLMYPLNAQQVRSSKAMQQLQPELKKLQDKYKNDREKLAQEQMRLYREAGVNPVGGCLPLLIQLPIWIGLYQAINHALAATPLQLIDLSGRFMIAGLDRLVPLNNVFLGMDLTQPPTPPVNPVYALALPLLVLVTSWVQSKMMTPVMPKPAEGEEAQPNQAMAMTQSMTTIMPIMMGFFSLSFSVGLSVYFVVSNVFSIFQYAIQGQGDWRRALGLPSKTRPDEAAKPGVTAKPDPIVSGTASKKPKSEPAKGKAARPKSAK
jgi:YidC/Oxa1 family membrane protein insertase